MRVGEVRARRNLQPLWCDRCGFSGLDELDYMRASGSEQVIGRYSATGVLAKIFLP